MPPKRMNREEFFAKLARFDEDGLRKALWNLYWRVGARRRCGNASKASSIPQSGTAW